jgi:hypothetical protein
MLSNSYTKKPNAIEEVVYDFLKDCNLVPLSDKNSETLVQVCLMPKDFKIPKKDKFFLFQLIEKRVEHCFTFKFTDERAIIALAFFAESAGNAIIYLWYIQGWCFKNNVREVDLDVLCGRIFAWGIFSEEDLKTVWDKQKVKRDSKFVLSSDNLLDYDLAGQSIQFKSETK